MTSLWMEHFTLDLGRPTEDLLMLDPAQCEPWPELNPRQHFDEDSLAKLEASIQEHGVLQNVVVHDRGDVQPYEKRFWIVAGESRWRCALKVAQRLPARARQFTEAQALHIALLENLQRNNLLPREEGRGFAKALALEPGLTQEQLGARYGRDQSYVSGRIRLLELPDSVGELVDVGIIPSTFARDHLFKWMGEEKAEQLYNTLVTLIMTRPEGAEQPVTKPWLVQHVESLQRILAAKPATPAAAPTTPPKKTVATKQDKRKEKARAAVQEDLIGSGSAADDSDGEETDVTTDVDQDSSLESAGAEGDAQAGTVGDGSAVPAADASEAEFVEPQDSDQQPGETTGILSDDVQPIDATPQADTPPAPEEGVDEVAEEAEPEVASAEVDDRPALRGVVNALKGMLDQNWSIGVQLNKPATSDEIILSVMPKMRAGKVISGVTPLVIHGTADDLDARLYESLRAYAAQFIEE